MSFFSSKKNLNTSKEYKTTRTVSPSQAYANVLHLSKQIYNNFSKKYVLADEQIFKTEMLEEEDDLVYVSKIQREFLNKKVFDTINLKEITEITEINSISISLSLLVEMPFEIDLKEFESNFYEKFKETAFNANQKFYFRTNELTLVCKVNSLSNRGFLSEKTNLKFDTEDLNIILLNKEISLLNLQEIGIGGLTDEFSLMFRRAFLQRTLSSDFNEKLGTDFVKGILLYGPPGTGKTLIARKISKLLNCRKPKVVNGPEILDKYVGESEKNIRELFVDAEKEYKEKKEASSLHIIIFDELDAICKQRSSSNHNHSDNIVNQILSKMDGIEKLNNILVIGMTNRIDLIDSALMRPGRFEIKIEIGLPDEKGREEIFKIHTKNLKDNSLLESFDLKDLSKNTINYTGAEISAIVKSAISYSLERYTENKDNNLKINENKVLVEKADFEKAIKEIKPLFGNSEISQKIFYFHEILQKMIKKTEKNIQNFLKNQLIFTSSLLIYGEQGSGKSSLACKIAEISEIPFIRIIRPVNLIGISEIDRINYVKSIFFDSYKSKSSLIILDDLESLIDFVQIGPRFSNLLLQSLKVFIKNENEQKNNIFIIGTSTNEEILKELGLFDCFDKKIEVPLIGKKEIEELRENEGLEKLEYKGEETIKEVLNQLID